MKGFWCLLSVIALLVGASAQAGEPVDVALVLAVDVSLSVNDERFQLQRDGIAAAFETPDLAQAIASGPVASLNVSNAAAIALYELARNQP